MITYNQCLVFKHDYYNIVAIIRGATNLIVYRVDLCRDRKYSYT